MKRLTTALATDMVHRIEALRAQIEAIYAEANSYGRGNDRAIRDVVDQRTAACASLDDALSLLNDFDIEAQEETADETNERPKT